MAEPDFDAYNEAQLRQVLTRIDASKYPERVRDIEARLAALPVKQAATVADVTSTVALSATSSVFWRRLIAFLIDMLVLGALGLVLAFFFQQRLIALGAWGRAVGFVVALAYFGMTESRWGNGRSLGKLVMRLRVVTRTGALLSIPAAFCRSAIFCLAYFLNGANWKVTPGQEWIATVQSLLIGALIVSVFYLLLFNRRTRQSLHDLAVGAFVVNAGPDGFVPPPTPVWRGHYAIAGGIVLVLSVGSTLLLQQATVKALVATQRAISALPDIYGVSVKVNVTAPRGATTSQMLLSGIVDESLGDPDRLAATIANLALDNYPDANAQQLIAVTLTSGYDIGIASGWRWTTYAWAPAHWRALAQQKRG